ncbi:MAG: NUDIX hydrolase [Candidatus Calescibacterium sp.]|nr:NUDIX hydrolase [Candidatus Calescibacterium sp.]MDW8133256.1 NUDIX hydrolase [Candidatus Calescibacterium sp.]
MYIFDGNLLKLKIDDGYELVEHPGASACIVCHKNQILLVKQYRKALMEYTWEIPAGKIDKNDPNPLSTVIREVFEETGIKLNETDLIYLGKIYTTPGFSNEIIHIFFTNLQDTVNLKPLDKNEIEEIKFFSKEEFFKIVSNNEIKDSKTLSAICIAISKKLI